VQTLLIQKQAEHILVSDLCALNLIFHQLPITETACADINFDRLLEANKRVDHFALAVASSMRPSHAWMAHNRVYSCMCYFSVFQMRNFTYKNLPPTEILMTDFQSHRN
jgi:hypothetical protein